MVEAHAGYFYSVALTADGALHTWDLGPRRGGQARPRDEEEQATPCLVGEKEIKTLYTLFSKESVQGVQGVQYPPHRPPAPRPWAYRSGPWASRARVLLEAHVPRVRHPQARHTHPPPARHDPPNEAPPHVRASLEARGERACHLHGRGPRALGALLVVGRRRLLRRRVGRPGAQNASASALCPLACQCVLLAC